MRPIAAILHDLEHFHPTEAGNWLGLDELLQELWEDGAPQEALIPLFKLLERFPVDDSAGVLMSVLHAIESLPNYEQELLNSLQRQPTEVTSYLVRRIENTGQVEIAGQTVQDIYTSILSHSKTPEEVRELVLDFLKA